jgi:hypothetical protein
VPRRSDQCIQRRSFIGTFTYYSVAEYEEGRAAAKDFSGTDLNAFFAIKWGFGAPPPERLTMDWQPELDRSYVDSRDQFRVCDPDEYDAQMSLRQLLDITTG